MSNKFSRADARFLLLMLAAHAVFFFIALHCKRIYNGDSHEYIYMAVNIKNNGWFYAGNPALPVQEEYLTLRPPGYPIFLWLFYLLGTNNWVVLFFQNIFSIINIWLLRSTMQHIGFSKRYDWLFLAFILLYPSQFINTNLIEPELLLQTCVVFYFYHAVRLWDKRHAQHAIYMSLALIAGMMMKPVWYPFVFIHLALLLICWRYKKGIGMPLFACAVGPFAFVLLYNTINYKRTGKDHFSSIQALNALFYNQGYFIKHKYGDEAYQRFFNRETDTLKRIPGFPERYNYQSDKAFKLLKQDIPGYSWYHIVQSLSMLADPGKGEMELFTGHATLGNIYDAGTLSLRQRISKDGARGLQHYIDEHPSLPVALLVLMFNLLRLVGFILFFIVPMPARYKWPVILLCGYFIAITGPVAYARYLMPISLIVMGCAAFGYQGILERLKNKAIIARPERYLA